MKKFWITVLCIAVTVISLAGCGKDGYNINQFTFRWQVAWIGT